MIPIEKLCITLEQAKKLKELGVKQDSHYYWVKWKNNNDYSLIHKNAMDCYDETYSAFTIGEIVYIATNTNFNLSNEVEDIAFVIENLNGLPHVNEIIKQKVIE